MWDAIRASLQRNITIGIVGVSFMKPKYRINHLSAPGRPRHKGTKKSTVETHGVRLMKGGVSHIPVDARRTPAYCRSTCCRQAGLCTQKACPAHTCRGDGEVSQKSCPIPSPLPAPTCLLKTGAHQRRGLGWGCISVFYLINFAYIISTYWFILSWEKIYRLFLSETLEKYINLKWA